MPHTERRAEGISITYLRWLQSRDWQAGEAHWRAVGAASPGLVPLLLFYGCYLFAASVGQGFAIIPGIDITFWPPAGLVFGVLLLAPRASWPWWLLVTVAGEFTANALWFHNPLHFTALYAMGNVGVVVFGALFLRGLSSEPARIESLKETTHFVMAAALAPVIAATVIAFVDFNLAHKHLFSEAWALVWLGDTTGILAVTPLMLAGAQMWRARREVNWLTLLEPALVVVLSLIIYVAALYTYQQLAYAALPSLVWLAVRSRFMGISVAIPLLAIVGAYVASEKLGVFAQATDMYKLRIIFLQSFLGIVSLVCLIVAALAQQYSETLASLRDANRQLEANVAQRTLKLEESEQKLHLALEAADSGTWALDESGGTAVWDERFRQAHGFKPDDPMTFETWVNAAHPDDQKRLRNQLEKLRTAPDTDKWECEYRVKHPELGERWFLTTGRAAYRRGGALSGVAGISLDITFRKTHEERLRLLMRESNHRKKNLLAVVMAIARHTVSHKPEDFLERFQARIHSLAAGYDLLINNAWKGVDFRQMIDLQLAHFGDLVGKQIFIEGPDVRINAAAAQPVGMALHELATNASKYGALSSKQGRVDIGWNITADTKHPGRQLFHISWVERGGPPVTKPIRKGFGTAVVDKMIHMSLSAEVKISHERKGLSWSMVCPVDQILELDSYGTAL